MDLKLNSTDDIEFVSPELIVTDIDQLIQRLKIKLRTLYGEWYLDTTIGLKYFDLVFVKNPVQKTIDNLILLTLQEDTEIISIVKFSSNIDRQNRVYLCTWSAETVYGPLTNTESFAL